jgi:hypothetical protein
MSIIVDTPTPTEASPSNSVIANVPIQNEAPQITESLAGEITENITENITEQPNHDITPSDLPINQKTVDKKYHGKSINDVIEMHKNAEKAYGRRGQEIGEQRSLIDSLIQANHARTGSTSEASPQSQESVESQDKPFEDSFYDDPLKAVNNVIEKHPEIVKARQANVENFKKSSVAAMESAFPDFKDTVKDKGFQAWVLDSPIRQQLFRKADSRYDVEAANELFGTWKQLSGINSKPRTSRSSNEAVKREAALKETTTETRSSGSSVGGKKMYRRSDLINLQVTDPNRYASLAEEIQLAYAEGRVK